MEEWHPSVKHIMQFFDFDHLPDHLKKVSKQFHDLAFWVANHIKNNPEKTTALRKLLEAKDCAVRAKLAIEDKK